jgi:hypothetical protein
MESNIALTKQRMELVQEYKDKLVNIKVIGIASQLLMRTNVCPHLTMTAKHNLPAMVGVQGIYLKDMAFMFTYLCLPPPTTTAEHNLPAMVGEQRIYLKDMVFLLMTINP